MSIGMPQDYPSVSRKVGSMVKTLRDNCEDWDHLIAWAETQQDSDLTAAGWPADAVTFLRTVIQPYMGKFSNVFKGTDTTGGIPQGVSVLTQILPALGPN